MNIKKIRIKKMISQKDIATKANISNAYLSEIESGKKKNVSRDVLEKIAEALDVSIDRLTGESASSIIEDRLEEIGMTVEELSEKLKKVVPGAPLLYWLQNLDTFIPGEMGGNEDSAYEWITKVADVLGLPGSKLRAALARQEIPDYEGPRVAAEEDFADTYFDNYYPANIAESKEVYAVGKSDELSDILEMLHKRPELKVLFSTTKNATKADIEQAVKIIEALKDK